MKLNLVDKKYFKLIIIEISIIAFITIMLIFVNSNFINFTNDISYENYYATFESFLRIIFSLSFNDSDVLNAYYLKLGINYKRQEENY